MNKKICPKCIGAKQIRSGGMLIKDCNECNGTGNIDVKDEFENHHFKIIDNYEITLSEMKKADNNLTDEEARKIYREKMLEKLDHVVTKKGETLNPKIVKKNRGRPKNEI